MEANPESLAILAAAAAATSAGGPSERSPSHGAPYSKKRKHPQHLAVDPALSDLGVGTSTGAANDLSIDHYLANPDHRAQRYDLGQLHHSLAHEPYLGHSPAHTTPPPDIKDLKRQHEDPPRAGRVVVVQDNTIPVAVPWHKHFYGKDLPNNPDGDTRDRYHHAIKTMPWTKLESKTLKSEILRQNRKRIQEETGQFHLTDEQERQALIRTEGIDWGKVRGSGELQRRTAADCKMRWLSHEHPSVKKTKWSKDELQRLYKIADDNNLNDWAGIARQLGTGRPAAECIKMYRARPTKKIAWTPAEDEKLKQAMRIFGENWQSVARMVGRHSNQCINRWTKTVRPHRKGKWTAEEDEELRLAVAACGPVWSRVAARVSGRSDAQCRERYSNVLDPNINRNEWTPEEDAIIGEQVDAIGKQWGKIVQVLRERLPQNGVRTDNKVMRRWEDLDKVRQGKPMPKPRKRVHRASLPRPTPAKSARGGRSRGGARALDSDVDEDEPELDDDDEEDGADDAAFEAEMAAADSDDEAAVSRARKRKRTTKEVAGGGDLAAAAQVPVEGLVEGEATLEAEVPIGAEGVEEEAEEVLANPPEVAVTPTTTRSGRTTKVRGGTM